MKSEEFIDRMYEYRAMFKDAVGIDPYSLMDLWDVQ